MTYSIPNRAGLRHRLTEFKEVLNRVQEESKIRSPMRAGIELRDASRGDDEIQEAANRKESACQVLHHSTCPVALGSEAIDTVEASVGDARRPPR
jgi:hypothetical protein